MYAIDLSRPITCAMAGRMQQHTGWEHNGRQLPNDNIFVFVIDGNVTFCIDGAEYPACRGDAVVIPRNTFYTANTVDFCEYFFFHFSGRICERSTPHVFSVSQTDFSFALEKLPYDEICIDTLTHLKDRYDSVVPTILSAFEYNALGTEYGRRMLDHTFVSLLYLLASLPEKRRQNSKTPPIVTSIIICIKENLSRKYTVADLCQTLGVSSSYAARVFKRHIGISISEYINREKMHYAKELLARSSMNVSEISDYLGYCDVFYFSKLFKRTFGIPPSRLKMH